MTEEEVRTFCQSVYETTSQKEREAIVGEFASLALVAKDFCKQVPNEDSSYARLLRLYRVVEYTLLGAFVDPEKPTEVRVPKTSIDLYDVDWFAAVCEKEGNPLTEKGRNYFLRCNAIPFVNVPLERFEDH